MLYPPSVMRMAKPSAIVFFTFLGFFGLSYARLVTRTIDDSLGDPVGAGKVLYQPTSAWKNRTCPGCFSQPDQDKTLSGTWTSLVSQTSTPFVEIDFTGETNVFFFFTEIDWCRCDIFRCGSVRLLHHITEAIYFLFFRVGWSTCRPAIQSRGGSRRE